VPSADDGAPAVLAAGQWGDTGRFTLISKSIDEPRRPALPCGIATLLQIFTVASWPVVYRDQKFPTPALQGRCTATSPYPPDLSWWAVKGVKHRFLAPPSRPADGPIVWQCRDPGVGAAPTSPASPDQAALASPSRRDGQVTKSLTSIRLQTPGGAHDPQPSSIPQNLFKSVSFLALWLGPPLTRTRDALIVGEARWPSLR
jgi:hypothetical protein